MAERFVLQNFNGDVAKGLIGNIARDVREGGGSETGLAVYQFHRHRSLVFDGVDNLRIAQVYGNVIVAMPVHQRVCMGWDFDVENANRLIF